MKTKVHTHFERPAEKHHNSFISLFIVLAAVFAITSCATKIPLAPSASPESLLDPASEAVIVLDGEEARTLAPKVLAPKDYDQIKEALRLSDRIWICVLPGPGGNALAIALGDYPVDAIAWRLSMDSAWKGKDGIFENASSRIAIAFFDNGIIAIATGPDAGATIQKTIGRASSPPGEAVLPTDIPRITEGRFSAWFPEPLERYLGSLLPENPFIPIDGIGIEIKKAGDNYECVAFYAFEKASTLRLYLPFARLIHVALSRALKGDSSFAPDQALVADGRSLVSPAIRISASDIARIFSEALAIGY